MSQPTNDPITLDSSTEGFLENFAHLFESLSSLSIPEQRQAIKNMFKIPDDMLGVIANVDNKEIKGKNGAINIRLFTPNNNPSLPVIVYFHRGGWVFGSLDECEVVCRQLANKTGAIVASVEYRLSPENKYPVPLEDCYDAALWVSENAASINADPNKIIICGESAGGNLAAGVVLMANDTKAFKIAGQLLIYPVLTNDLDPKAYEASPDKSLLSYTNMQFFWSSYLNDPTDGENPYASPLKAKELKELPSTFILTADCDALKHEGGKYAKMLQDAGVKVKTKCYPGVIHGFIDLPLNEEVKNESFTDIANWLKQLTQS